MIYAQKILFIRGASSTELTNEEARARNNFELVHNQAAHCDEMCARVRAIRPEDLEALESHLGTANEMLAHASAELIKEKEAFADLKERLSH